jgi:folylpolyglutamate synthase/dihydropteroate synthase
MCGDKDMGGFFRPLAKRVKRVWAVRLKTPRSSDPEQVAATAKSMGLPAETSSLAEARSAARAWALEQGGAVCIAGSLFLAGEVLEAEEGNAHG